MGAKIKLTGSIDASVRKGAKYYAFELTTNGSPTAPKGLPLPSQSIEYTVFVALKAGNKVKLDKATPEQKWLIEGEIALDIPVSKCPGEIGVIAFQISEIPGKQKAEAKTEEPVQTTVPEPPVVAEVAATVEAPEKSVAVEQETQFVSLGEIQLPEKFQNATLNPMKTALVREWILEHGELDKPLDVCLIDGDYWLMDGYRRYAIAKEIGLVQVPVVVHEEWTE